MTTKDFIKELHEQVHSNMLAVCTANSKAYSEYLNSIILAKGTVLFKEPKNGRLVPVTHTLPVSYAQLWYPVLDQVLLEVFYGENRRSVAYVYDLIVQDEEERILVVKLPTEL